MPINELSGAVEYVMDLLGIFAFALSGGFLAVRKDFDIFGTIILSEAAGLGGGLFRVTVAPGPLEDDTVTLRGPDSALLVKRPSTAPRDRRRVRR